MQVARVPLRRRLGLTLLPLYPSSATSSPICVTSSAHSTASFTSSSALQARRLIPTNCSPFYFRDGKLNTTKDNALFLAEHDISHDNGESTQLNAAKGIKSLSVKFGIEVRFSPRHIISPYHLDFLDPRGHPMAPSMRERYAIKAQTQPLWVIMTASSATKAVVRLTAQRRLRASLYKALEAKGYDRYGKGKNGDVTGTLDVFVRDPMRAVSVQEDGTFGRCIVRELEKVSAGRSRSPHSGPAEDGATEPLASSRRSPRSSGSRRFESKKGAPSTSHRPKP